MIEVIVPAKLLQCLWSAGNDAAGDACLHVGEAIETFAAHHRVGDDPLLAHPLQGTGTYFQQGGQFFAREPDFRCLLRSRLFFEDVIGDPVDFLA